MNKAFLIMLTMAVIVIGCTPSHVETPFFADEQLCKSEGGEWVETPFETYRCAISTQPDCERLGGAWEKQGLLGVETCVFTYPDAGKKCTTSDECVGGCILNNPEESQGKCKETDTIFGCWTFVNGPAVCVD